MKSVAAFISLLLALSSPAFGQTASDLNEGSQITSGSTTGSFIFRWWGVSGRTYFLQRSTDLKDWLYLSIIESGEDDAIAWGFYTNADKLFFRLRYTDHAMSDPREADLDSDGSTNWNELLFGTDPFVADADSDSDGLLDWWEQRIIDADLSDSITSLADVLATDPGDGGDSARWDFDGDGLDHQTEWIEGGSAIHGYQVDSGNTLQLSVLAP